jgi:cobalt-zinc-cadmium efflux system membrane fusion protein
MRQGMKKVQLNQKQWIVIVVTIIFLPGMIMVSEYLFKNETLVVHTIKVGKSENDNSNTFNGKLEAVESANIVTKISGRIGTILVEIGSPVKAGDTLLTLEANELSASVAQARANVEVAYSSLESARIDYEVQRQNYERYKVLVEQGALARADFDSKYALFAKSKELALNGSQAQVRQAEASLQLALANYQNSVIFSPVSGVVTAKNINVGELATLDFPLLAVVNLDKVFVMASIEEEKINQINVGTRIPIQVAAISPTPVSGVITNIAQASSATSKTYLVKILVDNPNHVLKPGMFAQVLWAGENEPNVLIPKTAVIREAGKSYVWTVKNHIVSKQEVQCGEEEIINVIVKFGLMEGQEVVISEQDMLRDNMLVSVQR